MPILEEEEENRSKLSEPDELEKDIQDFYKTAKT